MRGKAGGGARPWRVKGEKKDEGRACVKLGGGAGVRMGPTRYMVEERMGELLVGDGVHVLRETDERSFFVPHGKKSCMSILLPLRFSKGHVC